MFNRIKILGKKNTIPFDRITYFYIIMYIHDLGGNSMIKKSLEKMDRLFCVEKSIANLYQEQMQLEKENKKNSEAYRQNLSYIDLIHSIESKLIKEIYEEIGIETILDLFSDVAKQDIMMHVLSFLNQFDAKSRVILLLMDCYFKEEVDPNIDVEKVNHCKINYIYEQIILKNLIRLANIHSEESLYKEVYLNLKYNGIYTYANLFEHSFETDFATNQDIEAFCFLYRMSFKETEKEIIEICRNEVQFFLQEWKELVENKMDCENLLTIHQSTLEFYFQFMYDKLDAHLLNVDEDSFCFLQKYLEALNINAYQKNGIASLFDKIKDLKNSLNNKRNHVFVKQNLFSNIEFYK